MDLESQGPVPKSVEAVIKLDWQRFSKLTEARSRFAKTPCMYIQADPRGCPIRVGKASEGLQARYRGGTGYAMDAAMHREASLARASKFLPLCA